MKKLTWAFGSGEKNNDCKKKKKVKVLGII